MQVSDLFQAPAGVVESPVPTDGHAERGLLTALLMDRDAIIHVRPILAPADFWSAEAGALYRLICACYERREPPDMVVLASEAQAQAASLPGGTATGVLALMADLFRDYASVQPVHLLYYAERVRQAAQQRRRIQIGQALFQLGYRTDLDSDGIAAEQARILAALWTQEPVHGVALHRVLSDLLADLSTQATSAALPGIPTGFPTLDRTIYGWERGTINLLGALTSSGKTALALHFACAACAAGVPVCLLSLEMDAPAIGRRLLAMASSTGMDLLRRPAQLAAHDWQRLADGAAALTRGAPLTLFDAGVTTVATLQTEVQRAQADPTQGCGLLIVDYLQLMEGDRRSGTREQEVAGVSRALKRLARQCHCAVVVLAQLNDGAEGPEPPQLRDFRESRGPAMDATVVLALHRPDPLNAPGRIDLHNLKNRDGERSTILPLDWNGRLQQFTEVRL